VSESRLRRSDADRRRRLSIRLEAGHLGVDSCIQGVSRINRNSCEESAEATSGINRNRKCQASAEVIQSLTWGGRDSNPRPTDYESAASVSATSGNG
jgi:hypothetical protein